MPSRVRDLPADLLLLGVVAVRQAVRVNGGAAEVVAVRGEQKGRWRWWGRGSIFQFQIGSLLAFFALKHGVAVANPRKRLSSFLCNDFPMLSSDYT